jgi:putative hemolysin
MLIKLLILFILFALSGFFSGTETAFISLGKFQYKEYIRKKMPHYQLVKKLKDNPHKLISTVLIGNNLVNIAAASLATLIGTEFFILKGWDFSQATAAGIITGIMTIIILIFGEVIPKTYSNIHFNKVIMKSVKIIYFLSIVFTPFIYFLDKITNLVMMGKVSSKTNDAITEEEIKTIVNVGSEEGGIAHYERQLIHKIFQFDDKIVKEIMTPKHKVFSLDSNMKIKNVLKDIINQGYSRIPLYKDEKDNIVGIFHIKDLISSIKKNNLNNNLKSLAIKPLFIPESKTIDVLFKQMQRRKIQMAIVVDEFGALLGIVTIEDLIEEIVGEIYDEHDEHIKLITKLGPKDFLINGEATIREIKDITGIKIDSMQSETISSFILSQLGQIPNQNDELKLKKGKLIIEKASDKLIEKVRLKF